MRKKYQFFIIIILFFCFIINYLSCSREKEKNVNVNIKYLCKIGRFEPIFPLGNKNYFINIDVICCDEKSNLYIADSGCNKIFKFSSTGKYMCAIGEVGQGPGEFLADPTYNPLKMALGKDKNIYITDSGNRRVSIFSGEGRFIKQFSIPRFTYDSAQANSNGNIYLITNHGDKVINYLNKNFIIKESILDTKQHFSFPLKKPRRAKILIVDDSNLIKFITKEI